jgi:serine/threonine protein phosphatase PrpC
MLGGAAAGTPAVQQLGVADFLLLACDGLWDCMTNQQVRPRNMES